MATQLYYNAFVPAFSNIGVAIAEAKLYFYLTGTATLAPIYSDAAATVPLTNPVVANLAGKYPDIYMDASTVYRVVQTDKNNAPIGDAVDPYYPGTVVAAADPGLRNDLSSTASPKGANLIGYKEKGSDAVSQTIQDVIQRQRLNLYDRIPKNLWASIEAGTNTTDLSSYVLSALSSGRGVSAPAGKFRMKLNINQLATGWSLRGEGKDQTRGTIFENVDNSPIITLDSSSSHIVGFELEDAWFQNRDYHTYGSCDLLKITGAGNGEAFQNDKHAFRNLWFFQGRDNITCDKRSIWNIFENVNSTGARRDALHIETNANVNQWSLFTVGILCHKLEM